MAEKVEPKKNVGRETIAERTAKLLVKERNVSAGKPVALVENVI
jgi:hypothetical protein